jgi:hypothetical protein
MSWGEDVCRQIHASAVRNSARLQLAAVGYPDEAKKTVVEHRLGTASRVSDEHVIAGGVTRLKDYCVLRPVALL